MGGGGGAPNRRGLTLLLFDNNLSRRLVGRLADLYPGSAHVAALGLAEAPDIQVWSFAHRNGYTIVSKDNDFQSLALTRGAPPKAIILAMGNTTTAEVEHAIRRAPRQIAAFDGGPDTLLVLHRG